MFDQTDSYNDQSNTNTNLTSKELQSICERTDKVAQKTSNLMHLRSHTSNSQTANEGTLEENGC
jgi:hypothetical protein